MLEHAAAAVQNRGPGGDRLVRGVAYIVRSYALSIQADYVAGVAGLSRSHLYERFTQTFHFAPHEFVTALRLQRAQRLLAESWSVKGVAFEVGYRSPAAFAATFRTWFGVTPTEWKTRTVELDGSD